MHEYFVREEKGEKWEILDPLIMSVHGISTTVTFLLYNLLQRFYGLAKDKMTLQKMFLVTHAACGV